MRKVELPKIGQKVISKKTGLPVIGVVVGVMDAVFWASINKANMPRWDKLYPAWKEGYICYVLFKEPMKNMSFAEWKEDFSDTDISLEELRILYKYTCKKTHSCVYPLEDLEWEDADTSIIG